MLDIRKRLELLSPAKDLQCGIAAINHGADAVYIGAPQFSARKAAGNTIKDIEQLVSYAHIYKAKVFVALNTLLFDNELPDAVDLAWQLYRAGVDALIVQDFGLLESQMPPIELHASTQMDNRSPEKVKFLQNAGFEQVVLARELSEQQIANIASQTHVRLECFIHGALCVSYSGQCFMSQCINGRSANRGECGQPCRLKYDLTDCNGKILEKGRHLLSLKDMNQTANIEALINAGVSSFKIEGRLKEADYVSNITLHYRRVIDHILEHRSDLSRTSSGIVTASFEPMPQKSFNRGFTTYFFNGRKANIWSPSTPKSLGEEIGRVAQCTKNGFQLAIANPFSNGDGICYLNKKGELCGTKVNSTNGQEITPLKMGAIDNGTVLYRNFDIKFDALLKRNDTARQIELYMTICQSADSTLTLKVTDVDGISSETTEVLGIQPANNADAARNNILRQLTKLGGTPYFCANINIEPIDAAWFVPASELNALRRKAVENHTMARSSAFAAKPSTIKPTDHAYIIDHILRNGNVINNSAKAFFERHKATVDELGYERQNSYTNNVVMTTKHCLMHARGCCLKQNPQLAAQLPLILMNDKDKYELSFNCSLCEMTVKRL